MVNSLCGDGTTMCMVKLAPFYSLHVYAWRPAPSDVLRMNHNLVDMAISRTTPTNTDYMMS